MLPRPRNGSFYRDYRVQPHPERRTMTARDYQSRQGTRETAPLSIAFLQYRFFVIEKSAALVYTRRFPHNPEEITNMR
jgi:hypothetical protein